MVTEAEYECAFEQLVAGSGLKTPPKPGDEQYDTLREGAIATLIENIWLLGARGRRRHQRDPEG